MTNYNRSPFQWAGSKVNISSDIERALMLGKTYTDIKVMYEDQLDLLMTSPSSEGEDLDTRLKNHKLILPAIEKLEKYMQFLQRLHDGDLGKTPPKGKETKTPEASVPTVSFQSTPVNSKKTSNKKTG